MDISIIHIFFFGAGEFDDVEERQRTMGRWKWISCQNIDVQLVLDCGFKLEWWGGANGSRKRANGERNGTWACIIG